MRNVNAMLAVNPAYTLLMFDCYHKGVKMTCKAANLPRVGFYNVLGIKPHKQNFERK
jgi:hypothetical protein